MVVVVEGVADYGVGEIPFFGVGSGVAEIIGVVSDARVVGGVTTAPDSVVGG